ncbi:hypothetical protein ACFLTD_02055 [Elusimicrobiota bacterium]
MKNIFRLFFLLPILFIYSYACILAADNTGFRAYENQVCIDTNDSSQETKRLLGLTDKFLIGIGQSEWSTADIAYELGIGYKLSSQVNVNFNIGIFPYTFKRNTYERFKGIVFPVYFSGESKIYRSKLFDLFLSLGLGNYVYIGDVDVLYEKTAGYRETEFVLGINSALTFLKRVFNKLYVITEFQYHYTGYEFAGNHQFVFSGIYLKY